jgi:hypothetical protein
MPRVVNGCKEESGGANRFEGGANRAYAPRVRFLSWPRLVALSASAVAVVLGAGLGGGALTGGTSGCTNTTLGNADLISGIQLNTALLLGGLNCGTNTDDVYKYVAVVINNRSDVGGAGIFDCFADAVFANLPGTDAGTLSFAVWVYAYNQADFNVANQNNSLVNAVAVLNGVTQVDGSVIPVPTDSVPKGGASRGYPGALSTICLQHATWTSTCASTSQPGVEVSASCTELALGAAAPDTCILPVPLPDAGHD